MSAFIMRFFTSLAIFTLGFWPTNILSPPKDKLDKIVIGIVETTGKYYQSEIHWYDESLNEVYKTKLPYAALGTHFRKPFYLDNEIYMIPKGTGVLYDPNIVISINLKNLKVKAYPFNNWDYNDVVAIDDSIYTVCTLPLDTYIEKYNKKSKNNKIITLDKAYIYSMYACNNRIFAFTKKYYDGIDKLELNIFDKDLNLLKNIQLHEYTTSSYKYYEDDKYIYTVISSDKKNAGILKINKFDYSMNIIADVGKDSDTIYHYNDKFIVTEFDPLYSEGDIINILDEEGKTIDRKHLGNTLRLTGIYKDKFIECDGEKIRLYNLNNFELITERIIAKDIKDYSYMTSLIIR